MDRIAYRTYAAAALAAGKAPATASLLAEEMCMKEVGVCGEQDNTGASRPIDRVTRAAIMTASRNAPTSKEAAALLRLTPTTFTRYCRKWKIKTPAERRKVIKG